MNQFAPIPDVNGFGEIIQPNVDAPASNTSLFKGIPLEAYYDANRKEFLTKNSGQRWLSNRAEDFRLHLRSLGIPTKIQEGQMISPAEAVMLNIKDTRDVRYASPLAGRDAGFYEEDGVRYLVTESPRILSAVAGHWETLRRLVETLIGSDPDHGYAQTIVFYGWLKTAYSALLQRRRQPGQALALAGPVGCGKSLLQNIITAVLGGRSAKAHRYMAGQTNFNSELFGAEHLVLEDEHSSTDIRSRNHLASHIKGITVNEMHSCHAKGREAINLRPFWRLSISLNDQEENLLVLPNVTEDIADKLILLRCQRPAEGFPTGTPELRAAYWQRIVSELPAFIYHLTQFEIPKEWRDQRFGVRHFHHPELLANLEELTPETKLLELIDRELWSDDEVTPWEGTAGELEHRLRREGATVSFEVNRLLGWNNACGTYLGRIAKKHPDRIEALRSATTRSWRILPPAK